ncbi:hypothetical protein JSO62_02510 [Riemerella anatipestifer]|uniref:hypothetical protein n=1 Tax=Riemerella anatipestifer TaxID=34085 RepID=UPI0030C2C12E
MRKIILIAILGIGVCSYAQKKEFDTKMIGCYKGSEENQQIGGVSKYWVSCRLDGGKSILLFVMIDENGKVKQTTENGSWWTQNGKYYELHNYDNITDVYNYKVLENGDVQFKSIKIMGREDDTYEFIDYKVSDDL